MGIRLTSADRFVALMFVLILLLLGSGLVGAHRVFGYGIVLWLGVLAGLGFVRTGQPRTWLAAILVFVCLAIGMTGILFYESAVVSSTADTVLGFHPATAFLVYGIWAPGLFTLGVAFVLLFDQLIDSGQDAA